MKSKFSILLLAFASAAVLAASTSTVLVGNLVTTHEDGSPTLTVITYNLYGGECAVRPLPKLNPTPQTMPRFDRGVLSTGKKRCYTMTAFEAATGLESDQSPEVVVDTTAPPPPPPSKPSAPTSFIVEKLP